MKTPVPVPGPPDRDQEARVAEELRRANAGLMEAKLRLRDLSSQLIMAQEQERREIARDLHDQTGQSLSALRMHLVAMQQQPEAAAARVPACLEVVDAAIVQIRQMALSLRPTMLDDLGLADALQWALAQHARSAGWRTSMDGPDIQCDLPADVQTACFRIGQEALANAARHANATEVRLGLEIRDDGLELSLSDDGAGFDVAHFRTPEERRKHFGLMSMEERAGLVGGTFEIDSAPGRGTRIRVRFPLEQPPR